MKSKIVKFFVWLSAIFTMGILLYVIGFILFNGVPALKPELFAWKYTSNNVSMMPSLISTLIIIGVSLLIAAPIGVFTSFYLVEYADRNSKLLPIIRLATDTLAAVPSIVYGLFGMILFVTQFKWGYSHIAGILTITIMILPIIISSTEEGLRSVDDSLRMASFGLGAGKLRTIFSVVLPVAMPGILSGIILAIGRIVGESAALLFTLGSATNMFKSFMGSGRTLAVHMYVLSSEGLHVNEAFATGTMLIIIVAVINSLSTYISSKLGGGK